eukprot:scaffold5490_cov125-Cylindrotheca_fusiformis.AAC.1
MALLISSFHLSVSFQAWPVPCFPSSRTYFLNQKRKWKGASPLLAEVGGSSERDKMRESLGLDPRNNDALLEYSIDSFLRGEYEGAFADDAASPLPRSTPKTTVEEAVTSLRALDDPEPSHGAAVLLRFCAPLSRGERWEGVKDDPWKEMMRGSLTPTMLASRLRASEFSGLLDFTKLDVTDGATSTGKQDLAGLPCFAFVNVALYFEDDAEPQLMEFKLVRNAGVWLIDSVKISDEELFSEKEAKPSRE